MNSFLRIILTSLVIINSLGYDWLHTVWHYRNGPQSVRPTITTGRYVSFSDPGSGILAEEDDDRLVNTSQPFHSDWNFVDFPGCPGVMITQYAAIRGNEWINPDIPGFCHRIFHPPRKLLSIA